jgi:predicted nucleic acid-binding protein
VIIADTSVWIEFLKGNNDIIDLFMPYLRKNHIIASGAVFGELLQGVKNKREREIITGFWENIPKVSEEGLFIEAGNLSNKYKLYAKGVGLIDCYILAAALKYDLALWTLDKRLLKTVDILSE